MFRDPVTGDQLTLGEQISWILQGIIRRWTFLIVITVVTIVTWSTGNSEALVWWNLAASYLALLIEGTVGIAMFSQTRRDAVILRQLKKQTEDDAATLRHLERIVGHIEKVEEKENDTTAVPTRRRNTRSRQGNDKSPNPLRRSDKVARVQPVESRSNRDRSRAKSDGSASNRSRRSKSTN